MNRVIEIVSQQEMNRPNPLNWFGLGIECFLGTKTIQLGQGADMALHLLHVGLRSLRLRSKPSGFDSYLGEQDRRRQDDGEAPDEDETAAAVGHRAQGPRPHRKDDHDEPGRGFESRLALI